MYEVPTATQRPHAATWRVGLLWIVMLRAASFVGAWLSSQLLTGLGDSDVMAMALSISDGDVRASGIFIAIEAFSTLVLAVAQWLILRRYFERFGWWVPMMIACTIIYYVLLYTIIFPNMLTIIELLIPLMDNQMNGWLLFGVLAIPEIIYGCLLGLIQALFFRGQVARPFAWAWATIVSVILENSLSVLRSYLRVQNHPDGLGQNILNVLGLFLPYMLTAWVLVRFVRERNAAQSGS